MTAMELSTLIAELFLTIKTLSGYPIPERQPPVTFASVGVMGQLVCNASCSVKGFFTPERGIYIDERLAVQEDIQSRSVLLHEMVHYLQHMSGKYDHLETSCERWQAKEVEAYEIQHMYLKKMGVMRSFIGLSTVGITCPKAMTQVVAGGQ